METCVLLFNFAGYFGLLFNVGLVNFVVLWWNAYGGLAFDLQTLAKRTIGLCCLASGCERSWSVSANVSRN